MKVITKTFLAAVLTSSILSLNPGISFAQFPFSLGTPGGTAITAGQGVASDASGNVYVTGIYQGTVNFNPSGTNNMTPHGTTDLFLAKYDPSGDYLWSLDIENLIAGATAAGASSHNGIATDAAGNVYIIGSFGTSAAFYDINNNPTIPVSGEATSTLNQLGTTSVFVAKYSPTGVLQWKFKFGGVGAELGLAIATDTAGNILITGSMGGDGAPATFYDINEVATSNSLTSGAKAGTDCFVAKYDEDGNYIWSLKGVGTTANRANAGNTITTDKSGNVFVGGNYGLSNNAFGGTATIVFTDASGNTSPAIGNATQIGTDAFVVKFNSTGDYQWIGHMSSTEIDVANGIVTDTLGNVYVGGLLGAYPFEIYDATLTNVDSLTLPASESISDAHFDVFLIKFTSLGNYTWGTSMVGPSGNGGGAVATNIHGNIMITGSFQDYFIFNSFGSSTVDSVSTISPSQSYPDVTNLFVAEYNSSGALQCAFNIGTANADNNNTNLGVSIATDPSGNTLLTGYYDGTGSFNPAGDTTGTAPPIFTSAGLQDGFVAKFNNCALYNWCTANTGLNQSICGGPGSVTIGETAVTGNNYSWAPATGLSFSTVSNPIASPTTTTTYTLTQINATACTAHGTVIVSVGNPPVSPVITPSGPTTFCSGDRVALNSTGGYTIYLWSSGSNAQSINASTTGAYTVTVTNASGCSAVSAAINVTVNPTPFVATGPNQTTCMGAVDSIGDTSVSGDIYNWSPASGLSSATVSQPTATPTTTTTYTLTVTSTDGCSATDSVLITINALPAAPVISASGPTTFCSGDSITLTTMLSYSTYSWSNQATTPSIDVSTGGTYSVTVTDSSGCSAASSATDVTVNPSPGTPVISQTGDTLICSVTASSYQWYSDTSLLSGDTGIFYLPSQKGNYKVAITDSGCSSFSSLYDYTAADSVVNAAMVLYPSPASSYFIAESKTTPLQNVTICDGLGNRILSEDIKDVSVGADNTKARINIQSLTAGVYFVQLKTNDTFATLRLVKE